MTLICNANDSTTTNCAVTDIYTDYSTPPVKPSAGNISISVVNNTADAMTITVNQELGKSTWPSNQTIATDSLEGKATTPNVAAGMTNKFNHSLLKLIYQLRENLKTTLLLRKTSAALVWNIR